MKYYKDSRDEVYAYEDTDTAIADGLTAITEQQADALRIPSPTLADLKFNKVSQLDALLGDWKTPRIALANGQGKPKITFVGADQIQIVILAWLGLASAGGTAVTLTDVNGNSGTVTKSLLDSFVPLWIEENNRIRAAHAQRKAAIDAAKSAVDLALIDTTTPL